MTDRRTGDDRRLSFRGSRRAEDYPHGARTRYVLGCRCLECKAANAAYEALRSMQQDTAGWNGWVKPDAANTRIQQLVELGVSLRRIATLADISVMTVIGIRTGRSRSIRAHVEKAILGITHASLAHGALVPGYTPGCQLRALLGEGFSRIDLASRLRLHPQTVERNATVIPKADQGKILRQMRVSTVLKIRALYRRHVDEGKQDSLPGF